MRQKIYRPKIDHSASRIGRKKSKNKKDRRSHSLAIFFTGAAFLILGLLQTIKPILYYSGGGYGKGYGGSTFFYNHAQSRFFGGCFTLMGILILYWGYCAVRNARKKPLPIQLGLHEIEITEHPFPRQKTPRPHRAGYTGGSDPAGAIAESLPP